MQGSKHHLSPFSGEFTDRRMEQSYRLHHLDSEVQQFRLVWLITLLFFFIYGMVEFWLGQRSGTQVELRLAILMIGCVAVILSATPSGRRRRDLVGFVALLLVSVCYALLIRERAAPANPIGALLLLVVGIYMFSPGKFWLACGNGVFCTAATSLVLIDLPDTAVDTWLAYSYLVPANVLAALALARFNRARRQVFLQHRQLEREVASRRRVQRALGRQHRRNRALLYNTLPRAIARRLQNQPGRLLADQHERGTVLFADLVGFSTLSRQLSPALLLAILNYLFSRFDEATQEQGLEKIKTLGDAYMAVAGVPKADNRQECQAGSLALSQLAICAQAARCFECELQLRIGIHSGPLLAGVIGRQRFAYDVWGETVNIASRLQGAAQPGRILVSRTVREACSHVFLFGSDHNVSLRGCGDIQASNLYSHALVQPVLDRAGSGLR